MAKPPPKLTEGHRANFETLQRAAENGDLALASSRRIVDGVAVALVCAVQRYDDGSVSLTPLAEMVNGNPYELYEDPTAASGGRAEDN